MRGVIMLSMAGDTRLIPPAYTHRYPWPSWHSMYRVIIWIVILVSSVIISGHVDRTETIILPSLSSACYTRCAAKCEDTVAGISPPQWNMPEELLSSAPIPIELTSTNSDVCCFYYCSAYTDDDWKEYCEGDVGCLTSCLNLTSVETSDVEPPCEPTEVELEQAGPYEVSLSWEAAATDTQHQVLYVVQKFQEIQGEDENSETLWININTTMSTWMTIPANPCEELQYRVLAFNQYGTHGASVKVARTELPQPEMIIPKYSVVRFLVTGYFQYKLVFTIPSEWDSEDITDMVFDEPFKANCAFNFLPPTETSPSFVQGIEDDSEWTDERDWTFVVYFYEPAYQCTYYSKIAAVNSCGTVGEYHDIDVNLEDCEMIINYPCPTPLYKQPGHVENITAIATPGFLNVTFMWTPPDDQGSEGVTDYVVQWGPLYTNLPNPHWQIQEEDSVVVPWNQTVLDILIDHFDVQYGVKVAAVDQFSINVVNHTLDILPLYSVFSVAAPVSVEPEEDSNAWMVNVLIPVVLSVVFAGTVGLVIFILKRRNITSRSKEPLSLMRNQSRDSSNGVIRIKMEKCMVKNPLYENIDEFGVKRAEPDQWEIPPDKLTMGEIMGSGAFGQVVRGVLRLSGLELPSQTVLQHALMTAGSPGKELGEVVVAVKMLHDFAGGNQRQDFLQEMCLMKRLGAHPNIVSMIGCCTQDEPLCLVVEHVSQGDLLHYLRRYRHALQSHDRTEIEDIHLTLQDLLSFARQITMGMEYLSQKGFVHRDLATRNVMIGDGGTLKIGDFGLTRYIYSDKLYVAGKGARLPLKWMALESIEEFCFNTATDVWSFGVLLFELVTLGGTPYPTIPNRQLLRELKRGYRMEKPDNCTEKLYKMMCDCWQTCPGDRPSFSQLHERLDSMITEMVSTEYLELFLDETRDYYQPDLDDAATSQSDADSVEEVVMAMTPRIERTVSESTRGGADSGVGEKSSITTSQATLPSTSNISMNTLGSSPDSPLWLPRADPCSDRIAEVSSWARAQPEPGITRLRDPSSEATRRGVVTESKTTSDTQAASRTELQLVNLQSHKSDSVRKTKKKTENISASSMPILLHLQQSRQRGATRTSTSSMEQLLPGYSGASLSESTTDSGSHSWFGETNV